MMRFPFGETVILHRFAGNTRNAHGQIIPSWHPDEEITNVAFAPGSSSEPRDGSAARVITEPTIYLDGTVIGPQDQVTVRGVRYEVEGDMSGQWVNPFTGWSPGSAVTLKKVTG